MPDPVDSPAGADDLPSLQRALRAVGRELKWWQIELEHTTESLQRARRQRARVREQADALSDALATALSERYWATRPRTVGVRRLLGRSDAADPEAGLVREVEASAFFDGGWYLRNHPKVVRSGTAPALHYVRQGNSLGHDPGPRFSTRGYLQRHPEAAEAGLPALVHAERHRATGESSDTSGDVSPGGSVHV